MKRNPTIAVILVTVGLYLVAVFAGLRVRSFSWIEEGTPPSSRMAWVPPQLSSLSYRPESDSVRYGALLFNETPLYASKFTTSKISCTSCHAEGGIQPYASPMVGLPALFPMFNKRAGHMITLEDRVQECFVRSENGQPLAYKGPEMRALVDYISWLSQPEPGRKPFVGRGLINLTDLTPDPKHGAEIYGAQCAGCHGQNGEGRLPMFPPLWGPQSFNDGAGMDDLHKMAGFVQHNMPQNRMGILTPQEAFDVSAFVQSQPRPAFNPAYKHF